MTDPTQRPTGWAAPPRQRNPMVADHDGGPAGLTPIEQLQRWQQFGASWRVLSRHGDSVTISLCRCDGAEEVQRLVSADPALVTWLAGRTDSEQDVS